jgi:hypothetical protein
LDQFTGGRSNDKDIQRYIEELRPNESAATVPWIQNALNRNHNQSFVQNSLVRSGFEIVDWQNIFVSAEQQSWLSPDIVSDCLRNNNNVSLEDLLSYVVTFIAIKPKKLSK